MADRNATEEQDLPAGEFSAWLQGMQSALGGGGDSDVPCDGCTACCSSSQFVHIGPDETDTLAHIPGELLFPAPRLPAGHVLLGYDEQGRCPMLTEGGCSIYRHRPRTCRTYDCRVFPAAGVEIEENDQILIAQRARRWRFDFLTEDDRDQHRAVQTAARFVRKSGDVPTTNPTEIAVLAIEVHQSFLPSDPDLNGVRVILTRKRSGVDPVCRTGWLC